MAPPLPDLKPLQPRRKHLHGQISLGFKSL